MPVPLLAALVVTARDPGLLVVPAAILIGLGENLRLWGVAWIGPRSRTRTAQVGSVVTGGPYRWCRNPLYLGNQFLIAGMAALSGHGLAIPLATAYMAVHYSLVVRWEEQNLRAALGAPYDTWCRQVPRWGWPPRRAPRGEGGADWRAAIRSERSTFLAILVCIATMLLTPGRMQS